MTQGRNLLDTGVGEGATSMVPPSQGSSAVVQASQNVRNTTHALGWLLGVEGARRRPRRTRTRGCVWSRSGSRPSGRAGRGSARAFWSRLRWGAASSNLSLLLCLGQET